jgi:hypothetical protein
MNTISPLKGQLSGNIIVQPQIATNEFSIQEIFENPTMKKVSVRVALTTHNVNFLTVWEGDAYDQIGQWTDTDLINAVTQLLNQQIQNTN